ncbi:bud site selection protein 22 [Yamadazyma tenuis]|uniref:Bud-site selection protein n=1 Tax=Candida tenuis (strain ATCC 10573 / BCRC 21748 / CBS 615 / JCM 9827 / NBRC 10315 / NRRL Y-1498 / VKM Y-70) TaxID=590646 RepID=G3BCU5_CANTC|nr:Bud-site selection protein [Yamadazyma tenuis ATCC 10573]EGV60212.1 Bud-site selection protein [Yamadazyma tenuis ATCC 10573]WEJ94548.1 bud site selection protein 22 [Yamadazyma tenuis]
MTKGKSDNTLWKIDLLENKFLGSKPRYKSTSKLLAAKDNKKLMKKMPSTKADAQAQILDMKTGVFGRKYHGALVKLRSEVKKTVKADLHKLGKKADENKQVLEFLQNDNLIEDMVVSKVIRILQAAVLNNKTARENPPKFIDPQVLQVIGDKQHSSNPTKFFKDHCQNNKELHKYVSSLWNLKGMKLVLAEIEWSFRLVRGNLTEQEINNRRTATGKSIKKDNDENSDSEDDGSDDDSGSDTEDENDESAPADFEKFAVYDNLVVDSDQEDEGPQLDPKINYNEVTDEEPSEESSGDDTSGSDVEDVVDNKKTKSTKKPKDDFFASDSESDSEDAQSVEKKYNLPELTTGYISGGSDDEGDFQVDDDRVVKQVTSQRKNRRGQRARQKIWEQKYGKTAKHKQKESEAYENDKKRRQSEFEEREQKRRSRAQEALENAPSGSNLTPIGRKQQDKPKKEEHPSWIAKKKEEEKLKNLKFTGKKITFD